MGVYEERFKCSILFCPILTLYSGFILFNDFPFFFLSAECLMTKDKADQTVGGICNCFKVNDIRNCAMLLEQ